MRYEAVLLANPPATLSAAAVASIRELRAAGVHVGIVGPIDAATLDALTENVTGAVLVCVDPQRGRGLTVDESGDRVSLDQDDAEDARRAVIGVLWSRGIAAEAVLTVDGAQNADAISADLAGQVAARRAGALPPPRYEVGWGLSREQVHAERDAVTSSLFVLADGRVGISGAPLSEPNIADRWILAAGVYTGTGPETHLLIGPSPWNVETAPPDDATSGRVLDLRAGVVHEHLTWRAGGYHSARFTSLARPGTSVLRLAQSEASDETGPLVAPDDDGVAVDTGSVNGTPWMRVTGTGGGIAAAAVEHNTASAAGGAPVIMDRVVAYACDGTRPPDPGDAVAGVTRDAAVGFDTLLNEHRRAWSARWEDADVVIDGDDDLQVATRFALFHLMASVGDRDEAAVGARGLTGPAYRGHVFWDADTFVLPFLAATHPASARAMLEYRVRRLPQAIEAARRMKRAGARFPWESAASGEDVTPPSARDRTGRVVPIRTGMLEDHIVAEVAWAASFYLDWTGDDDFARGAGQRLFIETARYWASRARTDSDGTAHIFGVIGPDEYHEPVDDNAFTNVMARWNLRRALAALERNAPPDVSEIEQETWRALADALIDGYDATTGIYEQFAGFYDLEPLLIAEIAPRRPIAADFLLGADRVRAAQVIKQADVLMLHHLVPEEVAADSLEPNLRYYEPRTAHGSSLSPAIHAALFARARDYGRALSALRIASRIDLDDLTGSTAGGLHLATMGGLWQAFAFGFAGVRARDGTLHLDPRLPPGWRSLELRLRLRGSRVRVRIEPSGCAVVADPPVSVAVAGAPVSVGSTGRIFHRTGSTSEVQ